MFLVISIVHDFLLVDMESCNRPSHWWLEQVLVSELSQAYLLNVELNVKRAKSLHGFAAHASES